MAAPNGFTSTTPDFQGAPTRPPTPMPANGQGVPVWNGLGGRAYVTPRPHLLPALPGMPDPYAFPPPPLLMPGVPPVAPQLMGSLPFSLPGDTSQFGAPFNTGLMEPDPPAAPPAAGSVAQSTAAGPAAPTYSARVVAAVDRTQLGGSSTALPPPVVAHDGPDPLSTLLANLPAPTEPGVSTPVMERPATRASLRQAPNAQPG